MPTWLPSAFWFVLMVAAAVFEGVTATLVSLWFCAGALAALAASLLGAGPGIQLGLFVAVTAVTMAALRPLARKFLLPHQVPTNADRVVGRDGVVLEDIRNLEDRGAVRVLGADWTARSLSGEPIPAGTVVTVRKIEGVKLMVTPAETKGESA